MAVTRFQFVTIPAHDPAPDPAGFDFLLTPAERSLAARAACELERNRREQNTRDAMHGLATWKGEMHR